MNRKPQLFAIGGEAASHVDGRALFDVLQDLLIAGLITHNQKTAARFLHRLERVVVGGNARGAAPGELKLL